METTVKLYTLGYSRVKTYVTALLFVAGNIVLPQLSTWCRREESPGCPFISSHW